MTRQEAEAKLKELLKQADQIRREYCPEDDYLSLTIRGDYAWASNTYWDGAEHPIDCSIWKGDDGYED
jgi:hypothetical protein